MKKLVWFRKDLRITDNPALYSACKNNTYGTIAIYLITPHLWKNHDEAPIKISFHLAGLRKLQSALTDLNIPLLVRHCDNEPAILLESICKEFDIDTLFFNREYELNEARRDQKVTQWLIAKGITIHASADQCLLPPGSVVTNESNPYRVFTPFKKKWFDTMSHTPLHELPKPDKQQKLALASEQIPEKIPDFHVDVSHWSAGEDIAQQRLQHFLSTNIHAYTQLRNFPNEPGTSELSPYLTAGMISVKQCFLGALTANNGELHTGDSGIISWINQLIWRDFYRHIMVAFPRICCHQPFQERTNNLPWQQNEDHLIAWQQGKTGIPIVDAAMRQLNITGWMHNRCRMIVAMFFSKNLFLDWRLGERYFMQNLIDGDLACNNGGWQWCASTGTDPAPYFRIFNPITQAIRFDPNGDYIRKYCPELARSKKIYQPQDSIVDLKISRLAAISTFKRFL